MELGIRVTVRHLVSGGMMGHASYEKTLNEVGVKTNIAVEGAFVLIHEIKDDGIDFSVFYFDKEQHYFLKRGEETEYKYEGNAFGFEFHFSIKE